MSDISRRLWRIWQRNFLVYRRIWKIGFVPPLLEPVFYLAAFGAGLGALVGDVPYGGQTLGYTRFIAPGLVAAAIMQNSFFETTYTSFVRMYYQKTFDAMLATPLSLGDIIAGEIVWGATKSVVAAALMTAVLIPFGLTSWPETLLVLPLAALGGLAFGAIGMWFTGLVPTIDVFNLPVFLFVTPMFLFSGTFFPLSGLPHWAQSAALIFPLTHLVEVTRGAFLGKLEMSHLFDILYLAVFTAVFFPLAIAKMRKRLVK
jgi:lipooligosaccharide transport system permease protein